MFPSKTNLAISSLKLFTLVLLACMQPGLAFGNELNESVSNFWLWDFLGRLHPIITHFPISLLIFAGFLEIFTLRKFQHPMRQAIRLMVIFGSVAAVFSAIFGWLLSSSQGISGDTFDLHQYLGFGTAALSVVLIFFLRKTESQPNPHFIKAYREPTLYHWIWGGTGRPLRRNPGSWRRFFNGSPSMESDGTATDLPKIDLANFSINPSENQEIGLVTNVRMVLAHNCYKCHSGAKIEGELRLDEKEFVFQGGENGPVILPGNSADSELIRRITLPKNHKKLMPAKGKQLSDEEIALLIFWIDQGAPWPEGVPQQSIYRVADLAPRNPTLPPAKSGLENPIDRWVDAYFQANEISWQKTAE